MSQSLQLFPEKDNENVKNIKHTPMMEQYLNIKYAYNDCLIFYRLGDFYELFFEDAKIAAQILDIALTRRGRTEDTDIPMCGVPFHASESYIFKLVKAGYKIAICEQLESPIEAKKRGYKEVVKRDVVRIITPGTIFEDNFLDAKSSNYLASLVMQQGAYAIAWADISTGEFYTQLTSLENISHDLARITPKELLLSDKILSNDEIRKSIDKNIVITTNVTSFFDYARSIRHLSEFYGNYNAPNYAPSTIIACGSLIEYIKLTQKNVNPYLHFPVLFTQNNFMRIDLDSRKNLELFSNLSTCSTVGSLIHVIDKTVTSIGGRMLKKFLSSPLVCTYAISERLEGVEYFYVRSEACKKIQELLALIPDMERALTRLCANKGGPRDMQIIQIGIKAACELRMLVENIGDMPNIILKLLNQITDDLETYRELNVALMPELPMLARDGNFITKGYDLTLDHYRNLKDNAQTEINKLRDKYRLETGISNLKIEYNSQLGYYLEVQTSQMSKIQADKFTLRQNLASSGRYYTEELKTLEMAIMQAGNQTKEKELEIFEKLRTNIIHEQAQIALIADGVATLDVLVGLAVQAHMNNYVRPILNDTNDFIVKKARHPVVENFLKKTRGNFIANDISLDEREKIWLLTGPNMAGKSTYLRQNAIIAILAQIGSYVPAEYAEIGIVDAVFSRVGASDNLSQGKSTFMLEMSETANILNNATDKSLVIIDEIGRGTATYDGMAIAWSVLEYMHNEIKCRALFATHYHELVNLSRALIGVECYSMRVQEWQGDVVFHHEIIKGPADKSYGIYVAKLAGLPKSVIMRAQKLLEAFENKQLVRQEKVNVHGVVADEERGSTSDSRDNAPYDRFAPRNMQASLDMGDGDGDDTRHSGMDHDRRDTSKIGRGRGHNDMDEGYYSNDVNRGVGRGDGSDHVPFDILTDEIKEKLMEAEKLRSQIDQIDINTLTPIEALNLVYRLKG